MKITTNDINGVVGIVPTPAVPEAGHWSTEHSVNLPETARMISLVEEAGVRILLTNGTFGEGPCMTPQDEQDFVDCIVQTSSDETVLFAGVTTMNTRETVVRGRSLIALGADGLFLGRPMWLSINQTDIVRYYADIAEAFPGVPIVMYDNPLAFKAPVETDTYERLSRNPAIVAAKHAGGPAFERDLDVVGGRMRMLPIETRWYELASRHPDTVTAAWSGSIASAPEPALALAAAIARRDWVTAEHITARMSWAESAMLPDGSLEKFMNYSIQIAHARFAASELIDPGPSRPPYLSAPESYLEGGRESGRRWKALRAEMLQTALAAQ